MYNMRCKEKNFTVKRGNGVFEKNLALNGLYDLYAPLISEKKRKAFELYYEEDLSLFEIAQELEISRQGVRDLLTRTAAELETYEEALGLARKRKELAGLVGKLNEIVRGCEGEQKDRVTQLGEELLALFGL